MERSELKEIIQRVIKKVTQSNGESPMPACIWNDMLCDRGGYTTMYAIGEEG